MYRSSSGLVESYPTTTAARRDYERRGRVARNPAGAYAPVVYRRPPCVPRSRENEKRPAAGDERVSDALKTYIWYIRYIM